MTYSIEVPRLHITALLAIKRGPRRKRADGPQSRDPGPADAARAFHDRSRPRVREVPCGMQLA